MKKMLRFILLLVVLLGIAAAAGMWKVRQLADSKLLIKEETIFTLEAGTGRLALGRGSLSREGDQSPARFPVAAAGGT